VGDDLLKQVAQRLSDCAREHDVVARLGGDEFVVLQISDQPWKVAAELAARIIASLSTPFHLPGQSRTIGASVGIAVACDRLMRCEVLLAQADAALYRAKRAGRSTFRFFQPEPVLAHAV
jgi:diguanylate cyclase (GGDEF)-like protein